MTAVLNVLLEITVYSVVLYGAILLFQKVFHKRISAALNYAVWALLILRLMMPFTLDSGFHFILLPEEPRPLIQEEAETGLAGGAGLSLTSQTVGSAGDVINAFAGEPTADGASAPVRPLKIGWPVAVLLLWGMGALVSFAYYAFLWRKLHRKILQGEASAPEAVLKLVETCKTKMGVKADIQISVQDWLRSPALSCHARPKLLLPRHLMHAGAMDQLEFGIRHELTHYRRRDYIVNLLFLILRCAYWFNPVVHLAFRRMQVDMETACDASVAARLSPPERMRYIRTMIDLSGGSSPQVVLGMGMCRGRKAMEKRVRGVFMRKKTGRFTRIAAVVIAGFLFVLCFTTACQPAAAKPAETPDAVAETQEQPAPAGTESAVTEPPDAAAAEDLPGEDTGLNIYLSPDGRDENDGGKSSPVLSLKRAGELIQSRAQSGSNITEADVHIAAGKYQANEASWQTLPAGLTVNLIGEEGAVFDGAGSSEETWFVQGSPGVKMYFSHLTVQNYDYGILLSAADGNTIRDSSFFSIGVTPVTVNTDGNTVAGCTFQYIGTKRDDTTYYGAVVLYGGDHNTVTDNRFLNIEDAAYPASVHAVLVYNASYNSVSNNTMDTISGDPVRLRDGSHDNTIDGNRFASAGYTALCSDWFTGEERQSRSNVFSNNAVKAGELGYWDRPYFQNTAIYARGGGTSDILAPDPARIMETGTATF